MKSKLFRSISLATLVAVGAGVFDAAFADGMPYQQKRVTQKRMYKRAARPVETKIVERIIEKPVIVEKIVEKPVEVIVEKEVLVERPMAAVVDECQPVIIDRYEKRRRSLIHLGLFPFSLLD